MIAKGPANYSTIFTAPFARIGICTEDDVIVRLDYLLSSESTMRPKNALASEARRQIQAYLKDAAFRFDLPLRMTGSEFQRSVWREIARIPSGRTRTYGELARVIGSAARPVGGACGSNPIPLIVPCHRVLAASGRIGGFMHSVGDGPLGVKRWLLCHEGATSASSRQLALL